MLIFWFDEIRDGVPQGGSSILGLLLVRDDTSLQRGWGLRSCLLRSDNMAAHNSWELERKVRSL
jgi:hypothetical protein